MNLLKNSLNMAPSDNPLGLCVKPLAGYTSAMTNSLAIWLGVLIVGFFVLDAVLLGWGSGTIVMRGLVDLIRWVAFWR